VPLHGTSHVIGTFPRGLGLENLGTAQSVSDTVMRDIYPWLPLALVVLALLAITKTLLIHRLYPTAGTVLVDHKDRKSTQFFTHKLGHPPARLAMREVSKEGSGMTLLSWATVHGGEQAVDSMHTLLLLNRYRKQPSFGSIATVQTRLKVGWTIVVPQTFGTGVRSAAAAGTWADAAWDDSDQGG